MKGGVIINDTWKSNSEGALFYFIENCLKVEILTDDSISCITYVFSDLPPNIISPYSAVRSTNINNSVNQLLFKIGFISNFGTKEYINCKRSTPIRSDPYKGQIEAVNKSVLETEVNIQNDLFKKSFSGIISPFEPICPAIISYSASISDENKNKIKDIILQKLNERRGTSADTTDNNVTKNLFKIDRKMSLIVMEFMNGFIPLSNLIKSKHPRVPYFKEMHNYELNQMSTFGYFHLDSHYGNVMINPNYPYFTNTTSDDYYGRALIIDFGRAAKYSYQQYESYKINSPVP